MFPCRICRGTIGSTEWAFVLHSAGRAHGAVGKRRSVIRPVFDNLHFQVCLAPMYVQGKVVKRTFHKSKHPIETAIWRS
jgi:hypothetical protein